MIIASIDIGTNTVLLLIAEVNLNTHQITSLHDEQRMPRLGKGLKQGGEISDEKIDSLLNVLSDYQKIIQSYNCGRIIVTATNALRIARNSKEISKLIEDKFNFKVQVISGEKEAEFAYLGATTGINNFNTALIIDIGGGSTELIFGNQKDITYKRSFPIGSVSATENFLHNSPPVNEQIIQLRKELVKIFSEIRSNPSPDIIIGIAGTVTTLACMIKGLKKFDAEIIESSTITVNELDELIKKLEELEAESILFTYGEVLKGREDIITGGAIILSEIMTLTGMKKLTVSSKGIRYGAIVADMFSK
jgi:exopolyphosphatase/guanosine-5'-triphosphate,3'-diphosphate pyrophosphatase